MRKKLTATSVATAALLLGGLAVAGPAAATPAGVQVVSARYDCGPFGVTDLTIEATADNGVGSVRFSTGAGLAPADIPAGSISATLRLRKADGGVASFSGTANAATPAGQPVVVGPLTGPVAAGDRLDSYLPAAGSGDTSLSLNVLGTANTCTAVTAQTPGPLVF
ncbi:hypothetical protein [Streptomyces huiliensis]|uniref:hypothetical protein n=1 Tax=Streptomyces huiliensis TaxID=2876027 RepID=UPI001CBD6E0D|nr:hypothetical protein [Streptomyces huiliensis]MBZ4322459.1 hypothetical protein [Streptomyces huiliensis]